MPVFLINAAGQINGGFLGPCCNKHWGRLLEGYVNYVLWYFFYSNFVTDV